MIRAANIPNLFFDRGGSDSRIISVRFHLTINLNGNRRKIFNGMEMIKMQRNSLYLEISVLVMLFLASGCASSAPPNPTVQMSTQFDEADFAPYAKNGSSIILGQAFLKTVGGDVKYGAGETVFLFPKTPYLVEYFNHIAAGDKVENIDLRAGKYSKKTIADGQGNFGFENLPAGDYILITKVTWGIPAQYGIVNSGGDIIKNVTVKEGERVKVILTR